MNPAPWSFENHVACGQDICRLADLHNWYVDEMHSKKCVAQHDRFVFNSSQDDEFCRRHLFYNRQEFGSYSTFPCEFKHAMEDVMFLQHKDNPLCSTRVYYNSPGGHNHGGQPLSQSLTLSDVDRLVIRNLNSEYIALMRTCIGHAEEWLPLGNESVQRMRQWCNAVEAAVAAGQ